MSDLVIGRCEFGPNTPIHSAFIGQNRPRKGLRRAMPGIVRDALVRARAALDTASRDTPETLSKPERADTLAPRIKDIDDALLVLEENGL